MHVPDYASMRDNSKILSLGCISGPRRMCFAGWGVALEHSGKWCALNSFIFILQPLGIKKLWFQSPCKHDVCGSSSGCRQYWSWWFIGIWIPVKLVYLTGLLWRQNVGKGDGRERELCTASANRSMAIVARRENQHPLPLRKHAHTLDCRVYIF